jgi:hypothetical protein
MLRFLKSFLGRAKELDVVPVSKPVEPTVKSDTAPVAAAVPAVQEAPAEPKTPRKPRTKKTTDAK